MNGRLLIHVGLHKTGTTWLQKQVFVGKYGFINILSHEQVDEFLARPHKLNFDAKELRFLIRKSMERNDDLYRVVSSEILSGNPFFGARDSCEIADRIKTVFETYKPKILIVIREQKSMLISIYMQYLLRGGTLKPRDFFSEYKVPGYIYFDWRHYEYHGIVQYYQMIFGRDSVHVLTYEKLRESNVEFVRHLRRICGMTDEVNFIDKRKTTKSYSEFSAPFLRITNHFRDGTVNRNPLLNFGVFGDYLHHGAGKFFSSKFMHPFARDIKPVSDEVRKLFSGKYSESNIKLYNIIDNENDLFGYEGIYEKT